MTDYRSRSMWLDGVPGELAPRASLPGPIDLDVAVVGAGTSEPLGLELGLGYGLGTRKHDGAMRMQ